MDGQLEACTTCTLCNQAGCQARLLESDPPKGNWSNDGETTMTCMKVVSATVDDSGNMHLQ